AGGDHQLGAPLRVVGEQVAQVPVAHRAVVPARRLPLRAARDAHGPLLLPADGSAADAPTLPGGGPRGDSGRCRAGDQRPGMALLDDGAWQERPGPALGPTARPPDPDADPP